MKKYLYLALFCFVAVLFAGCKGGNAVNKDLDECDKTTARCWEVTLKISGSSETSYMWGTEYDIVYAIQESYKMSGSIGTWTYKANSAANEDACLGQNDDYEESFCWALTLEMVQGYPSTQYIWDTEDGIQYMVDMYSDMGYTASYSKSSAKTEAECEALNDQY